MSYFNQLVLAVTMLCFVTAGGAWAQEGKDSSEMQAMMEAAEQAATPGPQHEILAGSAGTWKTTSTFWMSPEVEPVQNEGQAERTMILGGRVLKETFTGDFMGRSFKGIAYTGYDNVAEAYWGVWIDNMSTALYTSEGECNEDGTECSFTMTGTDPMSGDESSMRIEMVVGEDTETHSYYETREGSEVKTMEIVYERVTAEE